MSSCSGFTRALSQAVRVVSPRSAYAGRHISLRSLGLLCLLLQRHGVDVQPDQWQQPPRLLLGTAATDSVALDPPAYPLCRDVDSIGKA